MAITKDRFDKIITKNIEVENEGGLSLAGTPVTATGAEINAVADVTPGAPAASQGVVLDSSGNFAMPDGGYLKPSQAVLASAGSGQSTYAQIADEVVVVTGADGTKGVALPAAVAGLQITVINDSASAVLPVAPINGGNDQINALTASTGVFTMGPGKTAVFIATSATKWYVEDQAAALPTTTELNLIDTALAGVAVPSKAAIYDAAGKLYRSSLAPAAAGNDVTNATALTAELNTVTGADGVKGVLLPVAAADETVVVVNTAAAVLKVYAITGSQINALGSTVAFSVPAGELAVFVGRSATLWYTAAPLTLQHVTAGKKFNSSAAPLALDGSNPTSFAHGLTTCESVVVTLVGSAAPGDSTSVLTAVINGANVDVYAWKPTTGGAAGNPTLVASTGTETFNWIVTGV